MNKLRNAILAATLASVLLSTAFATSRAGQVSFDKKLFWVHAMTCFPLDLDVLKPWLPGGWEQQYALYPLDTRRNWPGGAWTTPDVASGKAAGIDGFEVDMFSDGHSANGYLSAADKLGGFEIAGLLDGGDENANVRATEDYCRSAASHPSAAKVGDSFLVFTYGTTHLTPEAWGRIRSRIAADGFKTYFMPDLDPGWFAPSFDRDKFAAYAAQFESAYSFGWPGKYLTDMAALYAQIGKPYAGGMMPGYSRVGGGYEDAKATATYRDRWAANVALKLPWIATSTWNDLSEHTEIMPSSDWNMTRSELSRWQSAKWRGEHAPWNDPRLYVTTPQILYPGHAEPAEALVLNGSNQHVRVTIVLLDARSKPVGTPVSETIDAQSAGAATIMVDQPASMVGRFLRAKATITAGGRTISSVASAPILFVSEDAQPGFRTLYYSIPAMKVLPAPVKIAIHGDPVRAANASAEVVVPKGVDPQFSELLFNGQILKNYLTIPPSPLSVPVVANSSTKAGGSVVQPVGAVKGGMRWGFYMARVTDKQYRVGYSDPVYFGPDGDLALKASYKFDEGKGAIALDRSPYRRAGELTDVQWVSPGTDGTGYCVSFDGIRSRINFPLAVTPPGKFSLKVAVRPRSYDGAFFCDSGGLWMAFTHDGKVSYTRNGPQHWVVATGRTTIPLNQWTRFEFTWDGQMSRIFVNGKLDGEAPCGPKFASERSALGYNPYGNGSGYFNGDIDDFEIRQLL